MTEVKKESNIFANLDMKEIAKAVVERMRLEDEKKKEFFNSTLCKKMMQDIKDKNHILESESFAYFPEKDRKALGWGDEISDKDVQFFLSVMAEKSLGEISNETEDDCGFFNFSFVRDGLFVSLISGQGTSIMVKPFVATSE